MKAALISLGSKSSKWTYEAMKTYFADVDHLDLRDIEVDIGTSSPVVLNKGKPLEDYDCVYVKGSFRYIQIMSAIASVLENKVYMPICSSAFTIGHDKLLTHLSLQQHNIPMPETYISSSPAAAKQLLEKLNYPIVMKLPSGTQGKGVMFADSFISASSMLDAMSALNQPVLIQGYVETGGKDVRVIVAGDKVVAAMCRQAVEGEKRANIHAGGKGLAVKLDYKTKELAIKTAKAIRAKLCGVDILEGKDGPVVIEVNLSPGLQGITEATKINVAEKLAEYLYEATKAFKGRVFIDDDFKLSEGLSKTTKTLITKLEKTKKGVILPLIATDLSGLDQGDDILLNVDKNKILVTKTKPLETSSNVVVKKNTKKKESTSKTKKKLSVKKTVKKT